MPKFRTLVLKRSTCPVLSKQEINAWLSKNPGVRINGIKFLQDAGDMHLIMVSYEEEAC